VTGASVALAAVSLIAVGITAHGVVTTQVPALQAKLERALRARDREVFKQTLEVALRAHPYEPIFTLIAGAEAIDRDDPHALRWLTRTMNLAPRWYSPHELAARWLFTHGRARQATLELREIAKLDEGTAVTALCRLPVAARRAETIAFVARGSRRGLVMADRVAGCLEVYGAESARLDEMLLAVRPPLQGPRERRVRRLLARHDVEAGLDGARQLVRESPQSYAARMLLADGLVRAGQGVEALAEIQRAEQSGGLDRPALSLRARALAQTGDFEAMRLALEEMRGLSAGDTRQIMEVEMLLGSIEESGRNSGQALRAYEQALRIEPTAAALRGVIRCAGRLAAEDRVVSAKRSLCELEPAAQECTAAPTAAPIRP